MRGEEQFPLQPTMRAAVFSIADTYPYKRLLILARVAWVILFLFILGSFIIAIPFYFTRLTTVCVPPACSQELLRAKDMQTLQANGLTANFYAAYLVGVNTIFAVVWFAVGSLIFLRRSNDWMALFVSLFLITFAVTFMGSMMDALPSGYWLPIQCVRFIGSFSFGTFYYLFPNGRFVPRWTVWFAAPAALWQGARTFFPYSPFSSDNWPFLLGAATWLAFCIPLVFSQIYRYRYVSNIVERLQTKWVVFGISAAITGFVAYILLPIPIAKTGPISQLIGNTVIYFFMLLIPLSIGMAIFRFRLFDIDIIINRALVYGTLTICIVGIYVLIVGSLGALFTAQGNLLISLVATGIVAVLFQPLRGRLQ